MSIKKRGLNIIQDWLTSAVQACGIGLVDNHRYRHIEKTGKTIEESLQGLTAKEIQTVLSVICIVYASGYRQGSKFQKYLEETKS